MLLLLSNSSLALEILTHDAHQHVDASVGQHEMRGMHDMSAAHTDSPSSSIIDHGAEDCICDDICCVSSIGFGLIISSDDLLPVSKVHLTKLDFYRSISIDLLLPPPTR